MKLLAILIFWVFTFSSSAQIGLVNKVFTDNQRGRILQTVVMYPASSDPVQDMGGNRVFQGFKASLNSKLSSKTELPLVFLVHGTSGNWRNLTWLGTELVEKGAIVVAANHPGSTTGDATPSSVIQMWNQPKDISFLIDELLKSSFSKVIDTNKIMVIGSSLGGYSAMALAGVVLDFEQFPEFCSRHNDVGSKYFKPALKKLDDKFYKKANQSHFDKRITLAVALVPGFVEVMTIKSLQNISTPVLIVGAGLDENVPPSAHFRPYLKYLAKNSKYVEIADATHYSFLQICKPGSLEILAEEKAEFACLEKGKKTRAQIHAETLRLIIDFIDINF